MMIATKNGYLIRFEEEQIRPMGRTAAGVKGISLRDDDEVVSMEIIEPGANILHVTENGYGKQTPEEEYRRINRGGKGVLTCRITDKTGKVVKVKTVTGEEDLMLITIAGVLIRFRLKKFPKQEEMQWEFVSFACKIRSRLQPLLRLMMKRIWKLKKMTPRQKVKRKR